jgi:type VI secretion system secreted protein VgrG
MNRAYLLTSVHHVATVGGTYTTTTVGKDESAYTNSFTCIPTQGSVPTAAGDAESR